MKKIILLSMVLASLALSASNAAAHGWPNVIETVALFDSLALDTPESIVFDRHGNGYISMALSGEIRKIAANGAQSTLARLPIGVPLAPCGAFISVMGGLALDDQGQALYVTLNTCEAENRGVWKVGFDGSMRLHSPFPAGALINGIVLVGNRLFVADSELSVIWSVPKNGGAPSVWLNHPLLAADPDVFGPGGNGIQIYGDDLYVCVSDSLTIVKVPIRPNGKAGNPRVHADLPYGCDDFAFDLLGNIYATTDPSNRLLFVRRDGETEILFDADDLLDGPTAAAFGRRGLDRFNLYVTNAAFPFFSVINRPSLMRTPRLIPGLP